MNHGDIKGRMRHFAGLVFFIFLVISLASFLPTYGEDNNVKPIPSVVTNVKLDKLDIMNVIGGGGEELAKWDYSYAKGSYSQFFETRKADGKIYDLGGLILANGKTYPLLMIDGQVFIIQKNKYHNDDCKVTKITNKLDFDLNTKRKEAIQTSKDGEEIISIADGACLVLDPRQFPSKIVVIGVADSKMFYPYNYAAKSQKYVDLQKVLNSSNYGQKAITLLTQALNEKKQILNSKDAYIKELKAKAASAEIIQKEVNNLKTIYEDSKENITKLQEMLENYIIDAARKTTEEVAARKDYSVSYDFNCSSENISETIINELNKKPLENIGSYFNEIKR